MSAVFLPLAADAPDWLDLLGRAHPVLLHAPLGLLPAIALLEFGSAFLRRPTPRGAILTLCWFSALMGALAAASGLLLAREGYAGDTVALHKVLGITLAALGVLAAVLALLQRRRWFRIVLLVSLGVMVPAGHLGGTLTHGADFLFGKVRSANKVRSEQPLPLADGADGPGTTTAAAGGFTDQILPILERTCTKCHNPDKKKGELLLTTFDGLHAGGENGPVVTAGKPDQSPLLQRCELPLDHDDHMPPAEKPQPTAAELATLRAWIAAGAGM